MAGTQYRVEGHWESCVQPVGQIREAPSQSTIPGQAGAPTAPAVTAPQVPLGPSPEEAAQDSQEPEQRLSQQKPSTQNPVWQMRQAPDLHSDGAHACPCGRELKHAPVVPQNIPAGHIASDEQLVGHAAPIPSQRTSLAQLGPPGVPEGSTVHAPSAVAPLAFEQTSQAPPQALVQHTPSTHVYPAAQSEARLQLAPAAPLRRKT